MMRDICANPGPVFEQWVGIELWKRLQYLGTGKLHYLRTKAGGGSGLHHFPPRPAHSD